MTQYTREELNGVRKYKRELRVRRQRQFKTGVKLVLVAGIIYLVCSLLSILGLGGTEDISSLDKYPTVQSYVDHLNEVSDKYVTVEDVYGVDDKEVR